MAARRAIETNYAASIALPPSRSGRMCLAASLACGVSAAALLIAAPAQAQTWQGGIGNWSNASNWNPATVPNSGGATATVGSGTANVDGGFTVGTLAVTGTAASVGIDNNQLLVIDGSIVNNGTISLNSGGNDTELRVGGELTVSLSGTGTISLSNNANNLIRDADNATGKMINIGNLIEGSGNIGNGQMALDNQAAGVINANQSTTLNLNPNGAGFTNEGLMEATGPGTLQLLNGHFDQTGGGTILANGTSAAVVINNSGITGGVLSTLNGGLLATAGGTADSLTNGTITSGSTLTVSNNSDLYLAGSIANHGTIALNSAGNTTELRVGGGQTVTLGGGGVVTLSNNANNLIRDADAATGKLINVDNLIQGAGNIGNGQMALDNQAAGVINANQSTTLNLDPNSAGFTNEGLMEATGTGTVQLLNGHFDQTGGGTILANGSGAAVVINSSGITGGVLSTLNGGLLTTASGTVDSLTNGTITSGSTVTVANNSDLYLGGSIANHGTIAVNSSGNTTELRVGGGQTVTLGGGGVVTLSNNANNLIRDADAATGKLINVDNLIQGAGNIGNGQMALDNRSAGVINANQSTALFLQPNGAGFSNEGLMESTSSGGLVLNGGQFSNQLGTFLASGTSTVGTTTVGNNIYLQNNAVISGGLLKTAGGAVIETVGGQAATLDGSSQGALHNAGTYVGTNNSTTFLSGVINNTGSLVVAAGGNNTDLRFADGTTLQGGGSVVLSDSPNNRLFGEVNNGVETVTNANNTITGAGQLGVSNSIEFINKGSGVVNASGTNALVVSPTTNPTVVTPNGGGFVNQGLMEATNTGGLVLNGGQYNNNGGTIAAVGSGNNVYLQNNAVVSGGVLKTTSGGVIETVTGQAATLDGSSQGTLNNTGTYVGTNNSTTYLSGVINNTGSLVVEAGGNNTDLRFADGTTLQGGGSVVLSDSPENRLFGAANSGVETVTNVNNTITGAGQLGVSNSIEFINDGSGVVDASGTNALVVSPTTNAGLVSANGGGFVNKGLMEATNTGGLVLNGSQFNNKGGTIAALGAGNNVYLQNNAVVSGGLLKTTGGGVFETVGGQTATLDGTSQGAITNSGTFVGTNNSTTVLNGVINNTGSILLSSTGNGTDLHIADGTTLQGGGSVILSDNPNNRLFGNTNSGAETVTNVNNTISGAGQFGVSNSIEFINEGSGVVNANGTNALVVSPTTNPTLVAANGGGFVNKGLMEATNTGGLVLNNGQFNNKGGTIAALGAGNNVYLQNNAVVSGGLLKTTGGGVIQTDGGQTATLDGTSQGAITNSGTFVGTNNSTTNLNGVINNTGSMLLSSTGNTTDFHIANGTTLEGGGSVILSDNPNNRIWGQSNSGTEVLTNLDNTIKGAGQIGLSNSIGLVNGGVIESTGTNNQLVISPSTNNALPAGIVNNAGGVIESGAGSAGLVITDSSVSNQGTIQALNGSGLTFDPAVVNQNASGGTLTGGTWNALSTGQAATLSITGGPITTDAANITLSGSASTLQAWNGSSYVPLENSLTSIATGGQLYILADRNYTANTGGNAISNAGTLGLGGGTFTDSSLTNSGTLIGFGAVNNTGGASVANSGQVTATGGNLVLKQGVNGTGNVTIANGASLDLSQASGNSTAGVLLHNGNNLALGSNNITISQDYNNANFGSGNAFNNHANVTGTGSILAAGTNLSMTVTGTGVAGSTLALGNVHTGTTLNGNFNVNWNGTNAPVLRGGVGSTSGLTVTSGSFGPVTPGGSTPDSVSATIGSAGALTGQSITVKPNFDNVAPVTLNVTGAAYDLANPIVTPGTISFGNVHAGTTPTAQAITIANQTISNANFQEGLNASFGTVGTGITTNGASLTNLGAGTSSTALKVGLNTGTAGAINGTASINLTSNGSLSGLASTPLSAQSVAVTGAVYNFATSSAIAPVNFVAHVGDGGGSVSKTLSVTNTAPTGAFSEGLDSSFGTYTPGGGDTLTPTFSGSVTNLTAGSTDNTSLKVSINTSTAGTFNGSEQVLQASDGATTSHLGTTALATQNVGVSGSVTGGIFNYATATINNTQPVNLGSWRQGSSATTTALSISNTGPVGSTTEALDGNFITPPPTGFTGSGSFTGLQAGASPNTSITVGLDTTSAGGKSGTAQVGFVSDGTNTHNDGSSTPLPNQNVQLAGSVYRLASPVLNTPSLTVAARVGGGLPSRSVSVTNSSADAFTENLKATLGTPSAGFTASGGTQTITAGQTSTGLGVGLASTSTSGVTTGTVGVNFVSSAVANEQGAPDLALTSGSVSVTGKVYQTASASVTPSVSFGIVHVGDTVAPQAINVANTASGALVDTITGNIGSVSGAPFTNGGGNLGTGVAAGQNSNALTVGLNTSTAGVFTGGSAGSAVLSLASHDADLADVALTTSPVTLTAQVNNYAGIGLANATKGSLSGSGLAYTLNLGNITQNSGLLTSLLDLLNGVTGPADVLSMSANSFNVISGAGFDISQTAFANLMAGQAVSGDVSVGLDTASLGYVSETIQLLGDGSNDSGWDSGLNVLDPTLTLVADVVQGGGGNVPEPSSLATLVPGFIGLRALRRRWRQRRSSPAGQ